MSERDAKISFDRISEENQILNMEGLIKAQLTSENFPVCLRGFWRKEKIDGITNQVSDDKNDEGDPKDDDDGMG